MLARGLSIYSPRLLKEMGNHINEGARSSDGYVANRLHAFLETHFSETMTWDSCDVTQFLE